MFSNPIHKLKNYFSKILGNHTYRLLFLDSPIPNNNVKNDIIYAISKNNNIKWFLFKCPCGCEDVITLSAQDTHNPHWTISYRSKRMPSLYPSIWRDIGCFSHFWIRNGKVQWANDSGKKPYYDW